MTRKVFFTFIITLVFSIQPVLAQRKACKSADIAYERKQYNTAIERYKKALKKTARKRKKTTVTISHINLQNAIDLQNLPN